jgi:NadR type nicotinamide-nucleotide adenylyltransferase
MAEQYLRISIIGPECSGKTTLAQQLASHYDAWLVPEFARIFLDNKKSAATYEDLLEIAIGQQLLELDAVKTRSAGKGVRMVISDTDLHVIRIWSEIAFQRCDNRILSMLSEDRRDIYLLLYPDLAWVADGQREYPGEKDRISIFHHYLDTMVGQQICFEVIKGQGISRLNSAIDAIDRVISAKLPHQDLV